MYKVFVNDKPIILSSTLLERENLPVLPAKSVIIDELWHKLKTGVWQGVLLHSYNLEEDWKLFCENFKMLYAAGGLVTNPKKETLFILRANKWDLPKGHIEKGESKKVAAIREVEEECGIYNLIINDFLTTTYHIYTQKSELCLKTTYWYLMFSDYSEKLTPQIEEGITEAVFKDKEQTEKAFLNSYENIKLVYKIYKSLKSDTLS